MFFVAATLGAFIAPLLTLGWLALIAHQQNEIAARDAALSFMWRLTFVFALIISLMLAIATLGGIAVAYPEMTRHKYERCAVCHEAWAGGGPLTAYGRSAGPPLISTWSRPGEEGQLFGAAELPGWLTAGADIRSVGLARGRGARRPAVRAFPMQAEGDLSVRPVPGLGVSASLGRYGPDGRFERRRYGIRLAPPGAAVQLRLGRFVPAYGLAFADHRIPTRSGLGLGEGSERILGELGVAALGAELIATRIVGAMGRAEAGSAGPTVAGETDDGGALRLAVPLTRLGQVGASALRAGPMRAAGLHVDLAPRPWLWLLAAWDRRFAGGRADDLATARLGVEPWRGVAVTGFHDWDGARRGAGATLQWFPRPHFELLIEAARHVGAGDPPADSAVVLSHFYL